MTVIVWIVEGTWPACIDAACVYAPEGSDLVLLHVTGHEVSGAAHGAYAGLLGRARPDRDPGTAVEHLAATSAEQILARAAERLGRPCTRQERSGRVEREVVSAAEGADLLILARDGDRTHLGPRSLGPTSRFIVDHAPCRHRHHTRRTTASRSQAGALGLLLLRGGEVPQWPRGTPRPPLRVPCAPIGPPGTPGRSQCQQPNPEGAPGPPPASRRT